MPARLPSPPRLGAALAVAAINGGLFLLLSGVGLSHADTTAPAAPDPVAQQAAPIPDAPLIPELSDATPVPPPPIQPLEPEPIDEDDDLQVIPYAHMGGY